MAASQEEFFALIDMSVSGLLGKVKDFRKQYQVPITLGQDANATDQEVKKGGEKSTELLLLVNKFMLRRWMVRGV